MNFSMKSLRARKRSPLPIYIGVLLITLWALAAFAQDTEKNNQPGGDIDLGTIPRS